MIIRKSIEAEISWTEIKAAVIAGNARDVFSSGETIDIMLKNGMTATLVASFDKRNILYFVFADCVEKKRVMNTKKTNKGGWATSSMRRYLTTFFDLLPDDLQSVIEPQITTQINDDEYLESEDMLFLLSEEQVTGSCRYSIHEPGDSLLDIFTGDRSRVKEMNHRGTWWWLRSPSKMSGCQFVGVFSDGSVCPGSANHTGGVVPAFCLQTFARLQTPQQDCNQKN